MRPYVNSVWDSFLETVYRLVNIYLQHIVVLLVASPVAVISPALVPQIFGDLATLSAFWAPGIKIQSYPAFVADIFLPSAP